MFYVHDGVLLDPDLVPPQVFVETKGLVVDKHRILLPSYGGTQRWEVDGTNIPHSGDDAGTPDIYVIPEFTQQGGNILQFFIDLYNVRTSKQKFQIRVEIHQADYEPDVLFDESGELGPKKGERTESYGVFVPLRLME